MLRGNSLSFRDLSIHTDGRTGRHGHIVSEINPDQEYIYLIYFLTNTMKFFTLGVTVIKMVNMYYTASLTIFHIIYQIRTYLIVCFNELI